MSINQVVISGVLERDPYLRFDEKKIAKVRLDVRCDRIVKGQDGKWVKDAEIIPIYMAGLKAERIAGWNKQGYHVEILGRLMPSGKGCIVVALRVESVKI